jgi:purine-binding chemotaxis protein CheW
MTELKETDNGSFLISTFYLGDTLLGIDTLRVQEVIIRGDMTGVHHAPEYIMGVINLRGRIATIVDLGKKLNLTDAGNSEDSRIIIVDWENEYVGLMVDAISDVIPVVKDRIVPPPPNVSGVQGKFIQGVYQADSHLIAILDVEKVISTEEG